MVRYMSSKVGRKKQPFLRKSSLPRNCQWQFDYDYLESLGEADAKWLAKFNKEYYHANVKKGDYKALHKTTKLRRDCYNRKNRQNNDVLSIIQTQRPTSKKR